MSQESTKEPAFVLEGGCCFVAAVYIKKNRRKWMQASLPHFSPVSFSACFARSRSCAPQTAAVVRSAFGNAVFSAEKTSGRRRRCGGAIVKPARFAAAKRRSPAGATTQAVGRPGRLCRPGARSAQKKRAEAIGASMLVSVESTLFFDKPAETSQPKDCFSGGF